MTDTLWSLPATVLVDRLSGNTLDPCELLDAFAGRVAEVNPIVNALPTLCLDRARGRIKQVGNRNGLPGPLHGLPVAIKDSFEVAGVRTTFGSMAYADHVPAASNHTVEAIEAAGGVVYAKSNTAEFEAGANTFNEVFGATLNPWNTRLSSAGSSGGAAVAVATGMAPIAQGSDFACSLRFPAAFCGVVGLRPSPGVVPQGPSSLPYQVLSVAGPIARNVADTGLALDAMAGFEPRDPLTRPQMGTRNAQRYRKAAEQPEPPASPAFSMDLGFAMVARSVRKAVEAACGRLDDAGAALDHSHPDLTGARESFLPLRAFQFAALRADALAVHRDLLKPEVVWNIEQGLSIDAGTLARAEAERARLRASMLAFLDTHDCLITPATPVPPFPVTERYVAEIDGEAQETYIDWTALGFAITLTGCPAIVLPCGRTPDGLPVGIQIVGRPHAEARLLSIAAWCEAQLGSALDRPIEPVVQIEQDPAT